MHVLRTWDSKLAIAVSLLFDTVVVLSNIWVPGAKLPNLHLYSWSCCAQFTLFFFFRSKLILTKFRSKVVLFLKLLLRYSKFYFYLPYFGKWVEEPKLTAVLTPYPKGKIQSSVKQERKRNRPNSIRSTKLHHNKLIWFYIILYKKENHQSLNFISRNSVYSWFLIYFLCIHIRTHTGKGLLLILWMHAIFVWCVSKLKLFWMLIDQNNSFSTTMSMINNGSITYVLLAQKTLAQKRR